MWRRSRHAKLASVTAAYANTLIGAVFYILLACFSISQLAAIRTMFGHSFFFIHQVSFTSQRC